MSVSPTQFIPPILTTAVTQPSTSVPVPREANEDAKDRWEGEGGHIVDQHDATGVRRERPGPG
ncbi:hypothetical protein SAMN05661093_09493 [Kibdelosporangium aridum]|uniref:Uncharacterized protein n=1 Tax=Kibdelosporangium aridum TaxID=2030 RepID=A0A1W2FVJ1_KIBAR|nr:hypothetical protein SAMN05661093_09493 [Kibdelosporangium aridum]